MSNISYRSGNDIPLGQFIELYRSNSLGERRPLENRSCMADLLRHANLVISAWDNDRLVGIARSLTDFCFVAYLADLAVHDDFQRRGIGRQLIRQTRLALGPDSKIVLIATPSAVGYYPHLGFTHHPEAWVLHASDRLEDESSAR